MDNMIYRKIQRVAQTKDPEIIKDIRIIIGKYRLEALKCYGLVKRFIFRQADEIEKELNKVLNDRIN